LDDPARFDAGVLVRPARQPAIDLERTTVTDARSDEKTEASGQDEASARQPLDSVLLTPGVIEAVRSLVEIMERSGVTKVDLVHGDLSVRLRAGEQNSVHPAAVHGTEAAQSVPASAHVVQIAAPAAPAPIDPAEFVITSPMVGTYYATPSPGAPPFVQLGEAVEAGQTVGIVEAMKIMNEIVAERGGTVTALLVENGQAVEYGSPLIRLGARAVVGALA
jgi:acetyl-CoA carboxylase biotin carboxyl carrier protein